MRLWPILLILALLCAGGAARAADYQIIWFSDQAATFADVGSMREVDGYREVVAIDVVDMVELTAYRHRVQMDCEGNRQRTVYAQQVPVHSFYSLHQLEEPMPAPRIQGWSTAGVGTAGGRMFEFVCRKVPGAVATGLVRDSSPTEIVLAFQRYWRYPEPLGELAEHRWKIWHDALVSIGLRPHVHPLKAFFSGLMWPALVIGGIAVLGFVIGKLRPSRDDELQVSTTVVVVTCLSLLFALVALWGASVASPDQKLPALLLAAAFGAAGLYFVPYVLCWRIWMYAEGFRYRDYLGRRSNWRWDQVVAMWPTLWSGELIVGLEGGRTTRVSSYIDGADSFLDRIVEAKGWTNTQPPGRKDFKRIYG